MAGSLDYQRPLGTNLLIRCCKHLRARRNTQAIHLRAVLRGNCVDVQLRLSAQPAGTPFASETLRCWFFFNFRP
jgi:hypothetical protein